MAGNVIVVSGCASAPIVAGGAGSNGATFPIRYFLLGYDPATDPSVHSLSGVTSATPFNQTVLSGDTSLIQRGGHHIFASKQYTISEKRFLIYKGGEIRSDTTISNSDKSAALPITLDATTGRTLLNGISATSENDLYSTSVGVWYCDSSSVVVSALDDSSLLASADNYFRIDSYYPIVNPSGDTIRGVYKCRADSRYGEFIFNKVGLYMLPVGATTPVLVAVAALDTPITKRKTGTSITNIEFDIELEFNITSGAQPIAYMTTDYWTKIPVVSGYGLYTDKDIIIGTSGQGWPSTKAKLEVVSMGSKAVLCLHRNYNENYIWVDVNSNSSVLGASLSASTYMVLSGSDNGYITFNKANNVSTFTGSGTEKIKHGVYVYNSISNTAYNVNGYCTRLQSLSNVKDVKGFYSTIYNHYNTLSITTYGFYSHIQTDSDALNCDKYGLYSKIDGKGKNLYGVYSEIAPTTITGVGYAGYFKASSGYALKAIGAVDINGALIVSGASTLSGASVFKNTVTINSTLTVFGATVLASNLTVYGNQICDGNIESYGNIIGNNIVTKKNYFFISTDSSDADTRPYDKTGYISPVGSIVAWVGAVIPSGWLECNGQLLQNSTLYGELYSVIGTAYSSGSPSIDSFQVPDFRGVFLRGFGSQTLSGTLYSSGPLVSAYQPDALQTHTHYIGDVVIESGTGANVANGDGGSEESTTAPIGARISTETRPVNIAVKYIIKY